MLLKVDFIYLVNFKRKFIFWSLKFGVIFTLILFFEEYFHFDTLICKNYHFDSKFENNNRFLMSLKLNKPLDREVPFMYYTRYQNQ